jgi:FtsP/CotA-like multicopper oxidase with cupredoxin domain
VLPRVLSAYFFAVVGTSWAAAASAQEARHFDLAMTAGTVAPEWHTLRVKQGDSVELRWTSERPVRLHLHGYDLELTVKPGEPAVMAFKAAMAGRFGLSTVRDEPGGGRVHQHGARVLYLEVYP